MPERQRICESQIILHPDAEHLSEDCAERLITLSDNAIAARGVFHIALSGGSTPKRLYRALAQPERQNRIAWFNVHLYFGDERAVPASHPESNFRMVRESLLDHISIPSANIHRMDAEPEHIEKNAKDYAALLSRSMPLDSRGIPVFDLVLLGLGPDGHTCSLFPDTPILNETQRSVAPVYVERLQSWRLSLTYPVLNAARQLLFLVAGADKAAIVKQICGPSSDEHTEFPVERIHPSGQVEWHFDMLAAAGLKP